MMEVAKHRNPHFHIDTLETLHDEHGIVRIQRGDGFIRQHELRLLDQGPCDGDTLLLPAGEGIGALECCSGHVQLIQRLDGHGFFRLREMLEQGGDGPVVSQATHQDIGQDIEAIHQIELLKNHGTLHPPLK